MAEIVTGVALLHKCGIVYRELKPENLLITDQGHIKLTDYGLSKVIIENRQSVSTFVGTLEYMAPEALNGEFGQKADIWSLGMLMYELMFKENLFDN
jgi:serine/threonine protein kinase